MLNLSYVAILLALSMSVLCLPTGPNPKKDEHHHGNIMETTCESMSPPVGPGHPNPPVQTPAAPYTIEVSKRDVGTGERLQITLNGQNEENKFKGILVQARRAGSADIVAIGKFIIGTSGDGQLINCAPGNEVNHFGERFVRNNCVYVFLYRIPSSIDPENQYTASQSIGRHLTHGTEMMFIS